MASGFLQHPCDPDENHRTNEGHDNRTDDSRSRPNAEHSKNPTSDDAAEDAEDNVDQNAVAAPFITFPASQPAMSPTTIQ